jgi:hypothetical protein
MLISEVTITLALQICYQHFAGTNPPNIIDSNFLLQQAMLKDFKNYPIFFLL